MSAPSPIRWVVAGATAHPFKVIVAVGLLAGLAVLPVRRLELRGGIYELFPQQAGPVADLARYLRTFKAQEELVVLVTGPDPAAVARGVRRVAAELSALSLVRNVRAGVTGAAVGESLGPSLLLLAGSEAWPAVRERLTTGLERQVARLRQILLAPVTPDPALIARDPLLLAELVLGDSRVNRETGLYSSRDGKAALVFAEPVGSSSDDVFCGRLEAALERLASGAGEPGVRLEFTGGHLYAQHMSRAMQHDLALSALLALAGVALVQLLFFRSLRLIPLSALVAGAALTGTLAVAALTVGHLNALSLAFAALFIGMSDDVLIHITAQTRRHLDLPPAPRLQRAVIKVAPALVAATLTTVSAFSSFGLSAFAGLAHTGLLAACGLALNLGLALVFFPALGVLWPPGPGPSGATAIDRGLERLGQLARRRRLPVVVGAAALGTLSLLAARDLPFSRDLERLAPDDLPPVRTDRAIAARFERERHRLVVLLEGRSTEEVLQVNDRVAERLELLRRGGTVASWISLARLLPSRATQELRLRRLRDLDPPAVARRLDAALEQAGLRAEAFAPFARSLVEPRRLGPADLPAALRPVVARHLARGAGGTAVASMLYLRPGTDPGAVVSALAELQRPSVSVRVTGASMAGAQMAELLRRDLFVISLATLGAVLVILGVLVRRAWPVLSTLLSLLFAGVAFAGCLRLLGLEISLYNLMVIPIIIGYGVDDHLYLMHRALDQGIEEGVLEGGRPVLAATLTTIAAFAALGLCEVPGLRTLGLTGALGLGLGMLASLVVLPALLSLHPKYRMR